MLLFSPTPTRHTHRGLNPLRCAPEGPWGPVPGERPPERHGRGGVFARTPPSDSVHPQSIPCAHTLSPTLYRYPIPIYTTQLYTQPPCAEPRGHTSFSESGHRPRSRHFGSCSTELPPPQVVRGPCPTEVLTGCSTEVRPLRIRLPNTVHSPWTHTHPN